VASIREEGRRKERRKELLGFLVIATPFKKKAFLARWNTSVTDTTLFLARFQRNKTLERTFRVRET